MYNEQSADKTFGTYDQNSFGHDISINPKWGENLMSKFQT